MSYLLRARWATLGVAALAGLTVQPASADNTARAEIFISMNTTGQITHVGPDAGSTPSPWNCTTTQTPGLYSVSCGLTDGSPARCDSAYVYASYLGSGLETHSGTSVCGDVSAECSPQRSTSLSEFCFAHRPGGTLPSFTCEANYQGVFLGGTVEWTVLCRTYT